jgi:hypothetical protein
VPVFAQWTEAEGPVSLLRVTDLAVEITSLQRDGRDCLVRLFNSAPVAKSLSLVVEGELKQASAVELDGRLIGALKINNSIQEHRGSIALNLRPFGLATVRLHDMSRKNESDK